MGRTHDDGGTSVGFLEMARVRVPFPKEQAAQVKSPNSTRTFIRIYIFKLAFFLLQNAVTDPGSGGDASSLFGEEGRLRRLLVRFESRV